MTRGGGGQRHRQAGAVAVSDNDCWWPLPLIEQPARMTHCTTAGTPLSISDCLLRLSVGLEDCDELIADLGQALAPVLLHPGVLR